MSTGMDQSRLAGVQDAIREDIRAGLYHGAVIQVARGGKVALAAAIGAADAQQSQPLAMDSVFNIFSVTKAFTNLLVLQAIEQGRFALTTPISQLIPEFTGRGREKIQMWHLLSHQAGFPIIFEVVPGWYIDNFAEVARTVIAEVAPVDAPCTKVAYSPLANHVLMAEALLRTDPKQRRYRQIVQEEILDPLGMRDTAVGLRADLRARKVVPDFRNNYPIGHKSRNTPGPNGAFEDEQGEMPWVGIVSTTPDLFRFADLFRSGGTGQWCAPDFTRDDRNGFAQLDRRDGERAVCRAWSRGRSGSGAGLYRPRIFSAWHGAVPAHVRHAGVAAQLRQLRCRHVAVLGGSGARHHLRLPDSRRDGAQRQHAPLPEAGRHGAVGRRVVRRQVKGQRAGAPPGSLQR